MFETEIRIEFISDWHVGSGLGSGPVADSILNRDINGLPFIPGRAVKGALREGAWRLGLCRKDLAALVNYFWGTASATRASNQPGKLAAGSGRLPGELEDWLLAQNPVARTQYVSDMTMIRYQTALAENGMVRPQSLRAIECGIPGLFFTSQIAIDAPGLDQDWLAAYLAAVCATVKSIGADRARGLGNCRIYPQNLKGRPAKVPGLLDVNLLRPAEVEQ
ncbi:MAG: hypothetical protein HDQ91_04265 [Desulfovibrio sp.]|nr:hypothetical protein [Desulfovibrio sp.]